MSDKLNELEQAIVVAHVMRRIMSNFKPGDRVSSIETVMIRLSKFLKKRQRTNTKSFIYATEFERVLWMNVTDKYDKKTKIMALDFVSKVYEYFPNIMNKYAGLSNKIMEKLAFLATTVEVSSSECYEMERNDDDLLSTFINQFEPYSGVGLRKSLFSGKKNVIKNNMIIDGIKIAEGF